MIDDTPSKGFSPSLPSLDCTLSLFLFLVLLQRKDERATQRKGIESNDFYYLFYYWEGKGTGNNMTSNNTA